MSFFDNVFGATGCNPDGTLGQNAFTQFLDSSMDAHSMMMAAQQQEQMAQAIGLDRVHDAPMGAAAMPMMSGPASMLSMPSMPSPQMSMGAGVMPPMMWSMQQMYAQQMVYQQQMQQMQHMQQQQQQQHAQFRTEQQQYDSLDEADVAADFLDSAEAQEDVEGGLSAADAAQTSAASRAVHSITPQFHSHHSSALQQQQADSAAQFLGAPAATLSDSSYAFERDNPYATAAQSTALDAVRDTAANVAQLFEQGMQYYQQGHLQPAILSFEAILQEPAERLEALDENFAPRSWRMLGLCHAENDQEQKAIQCLRTSQTLDSYASDVLPALATCLFNEQQSVEALEAIQQWVRTSPLISQYADSASGADIDLATAAVSDAAKAELGELAGTMLGETLALLAATVRALGPSEARDAGHAEVLADVAVMQGILHNIAMDYERAVQAFGDALRWKPQDHSIRNKLAATLANSNRSAEAIPLYEELLAQRPRYPRGWMNLGISHANLSQYDAAARAYVRALHLSPEARHIWGYLRVVLSCMERYDLVQLSGREDSLYEIARALGVEDV